MLASYQPRQNFFLNEQYKKDIQSIVHSIFVPQGAQDEYVRLHKQYFLILEACEYKDHFLLYDMDYSIISTIDHDHEDYFPTYEDYINSFITMIHRTKRSVICQSQAKRALIHYDNKWQQKRDNKRKNEEENNPQANKNNIQHTGPELVCTQDVHHQSAKYIVPHTFGAHYQENAETILQLSACIDRQFPEHQASNRTTATQLRDDYGGIQRRMECLVHNKQARIYTDYTHHAPSLEQNYHTLREAFPEHNLRVVFQPHMAQRVYQ